MSNSRRTTIAVALTAVAFAAVAMFESRAVSAADGPVFTSDGKLVLPTGYRKWVFFGAPLTPNGLNNGKAAFPEFHNVYVQDRNLTAYQKSGTFPEGTVIVKELVLLRNSTHPDGSGDSASGRGFAEGEFNGMDVTVKDSKRFVATNGWGFFNFGHHALPYETNSKNAGREECAGCHIAGASRTDLTWVDFYPVLRGKN